MYHRATIYKHAKKPLFSKSVFREQGSSKGEIKRIGYQMQSLIEGTISKLRKKLGSSSLTQLQLQTSLKYVVLNRTVRRCMYSLGQHYRQLTAPKMKFSIKDFTSKCDQILSFLRIWSHLLEKSLMKNFIFCAVAVPERKVSFLKMTEN